MWIRKQQYYHVISDIWQLFYCVLYLGFYNNLFWYVLFLNISFYNHRYEMLLTALCQNWKQPVCDCKCYRYNVICCISRLSQAWLCYQCLYFWFFLNFIPFPWFYFFVTIVIPFHSISLILFPCFLSNTESIWIATYLIFKMSVLQRSLDKFILFVIFLRVVNHKDVILNITHL